MRAFICPQCEKEMNILSFMKAPTPWHLKCKHCGEKLKLDRLKGISSALAFLFGMLLGGLSIAAYSVSQIVLVGFFVFGIGLILYEYISYFIFLKLGVSFVPKVST